MSSGISIFSASVAGSGSWPGLLQDLARDAVHLVDRLDHVHRDADGARLVGDRARDRLADPPGRVGRELVAAAVFELVHRLHQADVAFLDQVEELQAAVGVLLRDRDHQAQVGLGHLALGLARLRFAGRHLLVDVLQVLQREHDALLQVEQLAAAVRRSPADCAPAPRCRRVPASTSPSTQRRLVSLPGKILMKCGRGMPPLLTTRSRICVSMLAHFVDLAAHAVAQPLDHARGEADRHQLVGDLVLRLEVLRAPCSPPSRRPCACLSNRRRMTVELLQRPRPSARSRLRGRRCPMLLVFALPRRLPLLPSSSPIARDVSSRRIDQAVDDFVDRDLVALDLGRRASRISATVVGQAEIAWIMCFRPSSMRLAISISPSRVSSSTEPISRMYMRTGSVVRPNSESTVDSAASAASSTSSSAARGRRGFGHQQRLGVRRLVVDLDAHVVEGGDDGFDLLPRRRGRRAGGR